MNIFELLGFLLLCAVIGFIGHLFSPHWGWLAGAIPAGALLVVMAIATVRAELMRKH